MEQNEELFTRTEFRKYIVLCVGLLVMGVLVASAFVSERIVPPRFGILLLVPVCIVVLMMFRVLLANKGRFADDEGPVEPWWIIVGGFLRNILVVVGAIFILAALF